MQQTQLQSAATRHRTLILVVLSGITVVCLGLVVFLMLRWPFRQAAVVQDLEEASLTKVTVGAYHGTYFPRPGCVLEHVAFQHNPKPGTPPLIVIEKLRIQGSFSGLFTSHLNSIRAENMRLFIPAPGSGEHFQTPPQSTFVIDELVADGGIMEVASENAGDPPLKFFFHNFVLHNVGSRGPATFQAAFSNPLPPGEIITSGKFGPWNAQDIGKTPVSGEYKFQNADLGAFSGISGLLSSSGKFGGMLGQIQADGDTDVPRFAVTTSTHHVLLKTRFSATVNAENGNTFLHQVAATFGGTAVLFQGSVASKAGEKGKSTLLHVSTKAGRIQDILSLFAQAPRAPMSGLVSFKAQVSLPPDLHPFLKKVQLDGDFGIDDSGFTNSETQQGVNKLSEGARGEKLPAPDKGEPSPETVLSDLKGHVLLQNGTARFSNLTFTVPGAMAQMQGTYNLISEKIDLHGTLTTKAEVSKTTQGMKAVVLKVLQPFFKKPAGYLVPVKITGTYEHPFFGLDLVDRDQKKSGGKIAATASTGPHTAQRQTSSLRSGGDPPSAAQGTAKPK
jgi:hypothetical protein